MYNCTKRIIQQFCKNINNFKQHHQKKPYRNTKKYGAPAELDNDEILIVR